MQILVLTDGFPPDAQGGFEVSAGFIVNSLAARGMSMTVLTREHPSHPGDDDPNRRVLRRLRHDHRSEGIDQAPARLHGWLEVNARILNAKVNAPILAEVLRSQRFDLALCFNLERSGVGLATLAGQAGLPVLWSIGDYRLFQRGDYGPMGRLARFNRDVWNRKWSQLDRQAPFRYAVFNCDNIRHHFALAEYVAENTWIVNRSCPIRETLVPYDGEHRERNFLVVCQIRPHKGVHVVLDAAAELHRQRPHEPWVLEIGGEGLPEYIAELHAQIERLGIGSRVTWLGKLGHEQVMDKMARCMAFISSPLWEEPFGRVTMEALAQGAPLISSDSGAVYEIPTEACAWIYPRHDASALARFMAHVLDHPEDAQTRIRLGHERAGRRFRSEYESAKYEAIIRAIVHGRVGQDPPMPMPREVAARKEPLWDKLPEYFEVLKP